MCVCMVFVFWYDFGYNFWDDVGTCWYDFDKIGTILVRLVCCFFKGETIESLFPGEDSLPKDQDINVLFCASLPTGRCHS